MLALVIRMGKLGTTLAVTAASVAGSALITASIFNALDTELPLVGWIATFATPLVVAPTMSWVILSLLFRIHRLEQQMRDLATYDALTTLYNRAPFLVCCEQYLTLARRNKRPLAVLFIDIDHFKSINDTHGHEVGDLALQAVSLLVKQSLRDSDVAGRMGGEEFVVALPETGMAGAIAVAEKIRIGIEQAPIAIGHERLRCTVSIGLSVFHHNQDLGIDALLSEADKALYESKRSGRNRIAVHRETQHTTSAAAIGIEGLALKPHV